jgi:hypothetical protein
MKDESEEEREMEEALKATPRQFVRAALGLDVVDNTTHVTVTDIRVPFGSVLALVLKCALSSVIIGVVGFILIGILGGYR